MRKNFTSILLLPVFLLMTLCSAVRGFGQVTPGTGLHFDGVNDYVSFATPAVSNLVTFTIEAWVKPTATSGTIFSEGAHNLTKPYVLTDSYSERKQWF